MKKETHFFDRIRHQKIIPVAFLFILSIIFFFPVFFQGKTFYAFDTLLQYLPWSSYIQNFRAHNTLITDPVNQIVPYTVFFQNCIRKKSFPFWNRDNFCGMPLPAGAVTRYTSPIAFLLYTLFPVLIAHDLLLWIHLLGAGLFMYLFLKKIGLGTCPSLIGSVSWMFNGYVMVWFEFEIIPILASSLPLSLYCFERWIREKSQFNVFCFIGSIAIAFCSGFAHVIMYQLIFIACYVLYRYFLSIKKRSRRITKKEMTNLVLPILLGVCITATFFINHLALLNEPQRPHYSFGEIYKKTGKLPTKYLITSIFPDFFGNPARKITFTPRPDSQPYNNYNELCIYMGILPLFLALISLPYLFKKEYALFFFSSSIIILTMAMGSILYYPLMKFIPGLNFSTPTRILYLYAFSFCVLAAIGADILACHDNRKWLSFSLLSIIPAIAMGISFLVQTDAGIKWATNYQRWGNWSHVYRTMHAHFAMVGSVVIAKPLIIIFMTFLFLVLIVFSKKDGLRAVLLFSCILILSYDLISFGLHYNTTSAKYLAYPQTEAIKFLLKDKSVFRIMTFDNFLQNSFSPFGVEDIGGYSSFYPKRYGEFLHLSQYGLTVPMPDNFSRWLYYRTFGSPLLDLINTKYILLPPSNSFKIPKLKLIYNKEIKIYENKEVFPRAFFVTLYKFCNNPNEMLKILPSLKNSDFRHTVLLEEYPSKDFLSQKDLCSSLQDAEIKIISYKSDRIEVQTSTHQNGFLVISNSYNPGWKAKVDNMETKIFRANYIMQAIPIKKGSHRIVLFFRPKILIAGIVTSTFGWILMIVLAGTFVINKWRD